MNVEGPNYSVVEYLTKHSSFSLNFVEVETNCSNYSTVKLNSNDDYNDEVNDRHYREEMVHWEIYVEIKEKKLQQMPKTEDLRDEKRKELPNKNKSFFHLTKSNEE